MTWLAEFYVLSIPNRVLAGAKSNFYFNEYEQTPTICTYFFILKMSVFPPNVLMKDSGTQPC